MSQVKLRPTAGYALIEPTKFDKKTASGIVLPDTHDEKSQKGKVVAIGKSLVSESGRSYSPDFKLGDVVVYKKWGGDDFKLGISGQEYMFVKFEDVLAVVEE